MRAFYYSNRSPAWNRPFLVEEWKAVDEPIFPGADGRFSVSNFGRVYDNESQEFVTPWLMKRKRSDKYDPMVHVRFHRGDKIKYVSMKLCRLVMILFYPVPGMDELEVNHIDGNTEKNIITNLCWCTHAENVRFAFLNGQITYQNSDDIRYLAHSDEELECICKDLKEGKKYSEIAKKYNILYQVPYMLHRGQIYREYYEKYKLYEIPIPKERRILKQEELDSIGMMLKHGYSCEDIANKFDCSIASIRAISTGKYYKSKVYDKYLS